MPLGLGSTIGPPQLPYHLHLEKVKTVAAFLLCTFPSRSYILLQMGGPPLFEDFCLGEGLMCQSLSSYRILLDSPSQQRHWTPSVLAFLFLWYSPFILEMRYPGWHNIPHFLGISPYLAFLAISLANYTQPYGFLSLWQSCCGAPQFDSYVQ